MQLTKLREVRKRNLLNQYQLARLARMSQAKYSGIERGDLEPNPQDRARIANALEVPEDELFNMDTQEIMQPYYEEVN